MTSHIKAETTGVLIIGIVLLALSGTTASAQEGERPAQIYRRARELMAAGNAGEARALYDSLLRAQPNHNVYLIGRARASLALGWADEAAADYAVLLQKFPNEPELRAEAAEAARLAGRHQQAAALDEAPPVVDIRAARLATVRPPRQPAARREAARDPAKRTYLSGAIRTGIMYDSNANQGPATELFNFGDLQVEMPGTGRTGSAAAYLGANFNFLHRIGHDSPWAFVADANLFVRANANRDLLGFKTREWQWGRIATGFRYLRDKNFFEFRLKGEIFDYQLVDNVSAIGPEVTYARAVTNRLHLITQLSGDVRIFKRDSLRNGFHAQGGQYARVFLTDDGRYSLLFGGKYIGNYAHAKRPSYHGFELTARLAANLTDKLQLSPHVTFNRELHRKPATVLDERMRRDNQIRVGIDATYRVNRRLNLEGNVQYVQNNSRNEMYSYRQFVVGGGMAWNF